MEVSFERGFKTLCGPYIAFYSSSINHLPLHNTHTQHAPVHIVSSHNDYWSFYPLTIHCIHTSNLLFILIAHQSLYYIQWALMVQYLPVLTQSTPYGELLKTLHCIWLIRSYTPLKLILKPHKGLYINNYGVHSLLIDPTHLTTQVF